MFYVVSESSLRVQPREPSRRRVRRRDRVLANFFGISSHCAGAGSSAAKDLVSDPAA
jgi:hypothetical protein